MAVDYEVSRQLMRDRAEYERHMHEEYGRHLQAEYESHMRDIGFDPIELGM